MIDTNFFVKKAEFNLAQIAEICGAALQNADRGGEMIRDINTMDKAGEGEICFFYDRKKKAAGAEIKASACVTTAELAPFVAPAAAVLVCGNPKTAFLTLNEAMYAEKRPAAGVTVSYCTITPGRMQFTGSEKPPLGHQRSGGGRKHGHCTFFFARSLVYRARVAFSTASTITPTSAKIAAPILA